MLCRLLRGESFEIIIGSGNGLAPKRRQAITWTNDDLVQWRIFASPALKEFIDSRSNGE